MNHFKNKNVIVTGGSRGIGLAIAKKNGDRVPEKHIELLIQQRNQLSGS